MAQETAGTIGIPVLKNEILPYLTDYAKRQERAELYKQKAAAAAAQKAAKEAEYVPEFKSAPGFGYKKLTKQKQDEAMNRALAVVKDPSVPRSEAKRKVNEENLNIQYYGKQDEQLEKEALNELSNINKNTYYSAPNSVFYEWAETQPDYQPTTAFRSSVLSNPDFIDFAKINKKSKNYGMEDISIEDEKGRETQRIRVSKVFDYEFDDDPNDPFKTRKVPRITGVNVAEAQKFIQSDPELESAYTQWSESKKNKLMAADPTLSDVDAEKVAVDEFMKKSFPDGELKYGKSFTTPRVYRGRARAAKKEPGVESTIGPRVRYTSSGSGEEVQPLGEKHYSFTAANELNAGIKFYRITESDESGSTENTSDGTYTTRQKLIYNDVTKTTLPFATQDINIGGETIYKGDEILPSQKDAIEKAYRGKPRPYKTMKGYEVTGNIGGKPFYGFVPEAYGADIENDINSISKTSSSTKKKGAFPK